MGRLTWDSTGQRFYEMGVDRGVLYVDAADGVSWPGLISVTESPSGGSPKASYMDGIKYRNISATEEFEATINAFSSPPEFAPCDGIASIQNGLMVTQQPRQPFSFCYRTKIGNDIDGPDHGYKIHIVYNALTGPSQRENNTVNATTEPSPFSWQVTTLPPAISGYRRTAHMVIDTRYTPSELLSDVEDILYGSDSTAPQLPEAQAILDMFTSF